jgi:hypothetical protein
MHRFAVVAFVVTLCAVVSSAEAQLSRGNLRLSIDADILSVASVELDYDPGGEQNHTVFGVGPNQQGGALHSGPPTGGPTPLGLGVGYVLQPKLVLGLRFGLGLDVQSPDGSENNVRRLGLSLMPGLTFVPVGKRAKLFLSLSPIFQVSRSKQDNVGSWRTLLGGAGLGIGTLIFITNAVSVDLGFHFEGRFGNYDPRDGREVEITDLRGLVRLGVSLWT